MVEYETKIIAFLDILGFRKIIGESVDSSVQFQQVQRALDFLKDIRNRVKEEPFSKAIDKQVINFSDSIVFSYSTSNPAWFVDDIIEVQTALTANGLLVRGGVTVGPLYHNESVIFGPAMVEAYYLESKCAKNPRIIVSHPLYDLVASSTDENFLSTRLKKDDGDGVHFIDFLYSVPGNEVLQNARAHCLASMNQRIRQEFQGYEENISKCTNEKERKKLESIRDKYVWLKGYVDPWNERYKTCGLSGM